MQTLWPLIMQEQDPESLKTYLQIIINLLTYNSAYIDADVICSFIVAASKICVNGRNNEDISLCLTTLDSIICYNNIPKEGLFAFVCLLCRIVNFEEHCTEAWRIARNLFGTHLGHSALYCLCQVLQVGLMKICDFRTKICDFYFVKFAPKMKTYEVLKK